MNLVESVRQAIQTFDGAPPDVALLDRVVARDQTALGELYDRHSRLLFGLIVRVLRDLAEAEEVLQEVFVQVWTRADTYRQEVGSPVGWLIGIARNRAIDRLRANAVRLRAVEEFPMDGRRRASPPRGRAGRRDAGRSPVIPAPLSAAH
jgi:RNA polymerase sigma-70 factor (ECF subfamily)